MYLLKQQNTQQHPTTAVMEILGPVVNCSANSESAEGKTLVQFNRVVKLNSRLHQIGLANVASKYFLFFVSCMRCDILLAGEPSLSEKSYS